MLIVITNLIPITENLNLIQKIYAETLNESANVLSKNLKEKYKNVKLSDRVATITITVSLENGIEIKRDYSLL